MVVKIKGKMQRVKEVLYYFLVLIKILIGVKPGVKMKEEGQGEGYFAVNEAQGKNGSRWM